MDKEQLRKHILATYGGDEKLKESAQAHYGHLPAFKGFTFEVKSINEEARTMDAIASTPLADRIGDVMHADGWELKNFLKPLAPLFVTILSLYFLITVS